MDDWVMASDTPTPPVQVEAHTAYAPSSAGPAEMGMGLDENTIDLCFILDSTGSMGSYLAAATKNIQEICDNIIASEKLSSPSALQIGLIAYRDHPPQDHSYILKNFGFTSDVNTMRENLTSLYASGGGDGPEAVTAALREALENMPWRQGASKMAVLVADAPPHGIGEYGDGFPNGSPCGADPLQLVRVMASRGITLFVVACEPALSGYQHATDFFRALADLTGGMMLPLTTANLLAHAIVGSALEQMDMERLIREVGEAVGQRIHSGQESVDDVAKALHETLMLRNESTKKVVVDNIYRDSDEARHNVHVWSTAGSVEEGRSQTKRVTGSRFSERYLASRYSTPSSSLYARAGSASSSTPSPGGPPVPPRPSASAASPPSRKIISDFAAFTGAPAGAGASVFATPVQHLPSQPERAAYRSTAAPSMLDDDDDEDDEGGSGGGAGANGIGFRHDAISLEQARRITTASAWRSATAWRG